MFNCFVFNPKVKPLMMSVCITIRSDIQMILIFFFHYILQISTLKSRLEAYRVLTLNWCFYVLTENNFFFMGIDEFIRKLTLQVLIDKYAFLDRYFFRLKLKLVDKNFRVIFFRRKQRYEVDLHHFAFDIRGKSFIVGHNDYYVILINI